MSRVWQTFSIKGHTVPNTQLYPPTKKAAADAV